MAYGSELSLLRALTVVRLPDSANPVQVPQELLSSEVPVNEVTSWVVMSFPDEGGFPASPYLDGVNFSMSKIVLQQL